MKSKIGTIVILTCKEDPSADYVIKKIIEKNLPFKRINLDEVRKSGYFSFVPTKDNWNIYDGKNILTPDEVGVIWQRRVPRRIIKNDIPHVSEYLTQEWRLCWEWWLNKIPKEKVLDTEASLKIAGNKMLQLTLACKIGFTIPNTIITSNPTDYEQFVKKHKSVVAKTLGGFGRIIEEDVAFGTIYTSRVDPNIIPDPSSLRTAPIILQEEIEKAYELRITVIDDAVFACRIDSQSSDKTKVDWRKYDFDNVPHSSYILDSETKDKILEYIKYFDIHFASFDFAITPDKKCIFFEMNPNSQWAWIEHYTDLKITDALIGALQKRCEL